MIKETVLLLGKNVSLLWGWWIQVVMDGDSLGCHLSHQLPLLPRHWCSRVTVPAPAPALLSPGPAQKDQTGCISLSIISTSQRRASQFQPEGACPGTPFSTSTLVPATSCRSAPPLAHIGLRGPTSLLTQVSMKQNCCSWH